MTDYFVGPGGSDTANGLTWANRKLTLNGAEDVPVAAGDTVYVGPGVYRELLTTDVDGTSGNVITYIGDVTGENTDSVGGIVRITGSDNDQTTARANTIACSNEDYRTFRGFMLDTTSGYVVQQSNGTNFVLEDCWIEGGSNGVFLGTVTITDATVRRCVILLATQAGIWISNASTGITVENCLIITGADNNCRGIRISEDAAGTIKNCTFISGRPACIHVSTGLTGVFNVNQCVLYGGDVGLSAAVTGDIVEDYNTFYKNGGDRINVAVGGNSVTYPPLLLPPILFDGLKFPWWFGELSEWSQIARLAGTGEAIDDLFGIVRPTTSAKKSWGAVQLREAERETGTVQTGSAALTLADAGDHQVFVPVTATSTTFEVAARYESEYAGTLPRLIVRQPGQADQVDTMVAAADTWETLSLTFTPNATPPYVVVIFRSLNTSVTGEFDTYWDDLDVS